LEGIDGRSGLGRLATNVVGPATTGVVIGEKDGAVTSLVEALEEVLVANSVVVLALGIEYFNTTNTSRIKKADVTTRDMCDVLRTGCLVASSA
jgi:6-phosphogluconate dehydrogenase